MLRRIRTFIEFLGRHPFATGLFALMGAAGLFLSVVAFRIDRMEAEQGSAQAARIETKVEKAETNQTASVRVVEAKVDALNDKIGQSHRGGIFLFEEQVEMYWNDWWAHPVTVAGDRDFANQVEVTIRGEGKTVDFSGVLSMNCENRKYFWTAANNFQTPLTDEAEIAEIVPPQVSRNVGKLFCR